MYFVFDKRKISSFFISMGTVMMLLTFSFFINENSNKTLETMGIPINEKIIDKVENETNKVSITINFWKDFKNLDKILNALNNSGVDATFYITEKLIKNFPNEIKKITNTDNEVGLFINNYNNFKRNNNNVILNKIKEEIEVSEKILNKKIKTIRFENNQLNEELVNKIEKMNIKIINYNIDLLNVNVMDFKENTKMVNEKISPGSIISMNNSECYSMEILENVIKIIKDRKFYLVKISDLISGIANFKENKE